MTKYKYYLRKPRGEIVKDILWWLAVSGTLVIAVTAPKFFGVMLREFSKRHPSHKRVSSESAFRRLLKDDCIKVEREGLHVSISLTEKGRRKAGWLQIDKLKIKKPKKWDGYWRVVIFDIPHHNRFVREVLRGFLKRLGFYPLQKSVWIHPHDCRDEVELLKDFFGLSSLEIRLIVARDIGADHTLRTLFRL